MISRVFIDFVFIGITQSNQGENTNLYTYIIVTLVRILFSL